MLLFHGDTVTEKSHLLNTQNDFKSKLIIRIAKYLFERFPIHNGLKQVKCFITAASEHSSGDL